ncbi:MAG: hypothetical protein OEZ59_02340 [Deltaproteobacteria bacterium]|nr:hypothetical protein [Deltaproteobacteria bacterium]
MAVNLRPFSTRNPLWIQDSDYTDCIGRKQKGWSNCRDETEWLAKLHYLRQGFSEGKLARDSFEEREMRLVQSWLSRMI